jgi:mannosyltransferase OCH1-like enzyme
MYFYSDLTDYLRTIAVYLYGGTYLDMDALILQPLPNEKFIGYDQIDANEQCV